METPNNIQVSQSSTLDENPEISPNFPQEDTKTSQKEANVDGVLEKHEQRPVVAHQADSQRDLTSYLQGLSLCTSSLEPAESSGSEKANHSCGPSRIESKKRNDEAQNGENKPQENQNPPNPADDNFETPQSQDFSMSPLPSYPPQSASSGTTQINIPPPIPVPANPFPEPTKDYILQASLLPHRLASPTMKLLILDLNGTLLYRPRNPAKDRDEDMRQVSMMPTLRPHLQEFMSYIFKHFKVMFWSSATPRNVDSMIAATTTPEQRAELVATWARDTLGLSPEDYNKKSITFKNLQKVFTDEGIRKTSREAEGWNVGNTILLDDSVIKASFQPYNHVCLPEFVGGEQDDALWQVAGYLEELKYQSSVMRFIKQNPFKLGDGWNGICMRLA